MNGIDLTIIDDTITNIEEIINILNNTEINKDIAEQLKTLKNSLSSKDIINKEALENAINTKLMDFEMKSAEQTDNITTLRILQETNEEFKNIGIIQSPPEKNDSNKYIDYITFTNDYGELEVLCCDSSNFINDFIEQHKDQIQTYSAKEVFNHFKEYIHRELKFVNKEEYEKDDSLNNSSIVREEQIKEAEYETIEDYKKKYSIQGKIEMTVDQFGERLYRLGDGLFTFKTINGNRVMETLKKPTLTKNNVNDLLDELDQEQELPSITPTKPIEEGYKTKIDDNYEAIENIDEQNFDEEYFKELTAKKDVYDVELNSTEEHNLNVYIKYLINKMESDINNQVAFNHSTELIYDYLESPRGDKPSIVDAYENAKSGYTNESGLSELEKEFARRYLENKQKMHSLGLDQTQNKKLELENNKINETGISTIVMLMEIIVLAMFVIMILRLDI